MLDLADAIFKYVELDLKPKPITDRLNPFVSYSELNEHPATVIGFKLKRGSKGGEERIEDYSVPYTRSWLHAMHGAVLKETRGGKTTTLQARAYRFLCYPRNKQPVIAIGGEKIEDFLHFLVPIDLARKKDDKLVKRLRMFPNPQEEGNDRPKAIDPRKLNIWMVFNPSYINEYIYELYEDGIIRFFAFEPKMQFELREFAEASMRLEEIQSLAYNILVDRYEREYGEIDIEEFAEFIRESEMIHHAAKKGLDLKILSLKSKGIIRDRYDSVEETEFGDIEIEIIGKRDIKEKILNGGKALHAFSPASMTRGFRTWESASFVLLVFGAFMQCVWEGACKQLTPFWLEEAETTFGEKTSSYRSVREIQTSASEVLEYQARLVAGLNAEFWISTQNPRQIRASTYGQLHQKTLLAGFYDIDYVLYQKREKMMFESKPELYERISSRLPRGFAVDILTIDKPQLVEYMVAIPPCHIPRDNESFVEFMRLYRRWKNEFGYYHYP